MSLASELRSNGMLQKILDLKITSDRYWRKNAGTCQEMSVRVTASPETWRLSRRGPPASFLGFAAEPRSLRSCGNRIHNNDILLPAEYRFLWTLVCFLSLPSSCLRCFASV